MKMKQRLNLLDTPCLPNESLALVALKYQLNKWIGVTFNFCAQL